MAELELGFLVWDRFGHTGAKPGGERKGEGGGGRPPGRGGTGTGWYWPEQRGKVAATRLGERAEEGIE